MIKRLSLLALLTIFAQQSSTQWAQAAEKPVLDFEADVIEGEKRKPDLFIQLEGSGVGNMDAILYSREDFNDYQELDRRWRPKARRVKGQGGKRP